tara:strand:- start:337 stop:735 length:399 start_codon:yes stop_codon:yes gene_type:complete
MITDYCAFCGTKENLQIHHIIPISLGGTDDKTNLLTACSKCHEKIHLVRPGAFKNSDTIKKKLAELKAKGVKLGRPSKVNDALKQKVYDLHYLGVSYNWISRQLKIGMQTSRDILKEKETLDGINRDFKYGN